MYSLIIVTYIKINKYIIFSVHARHNCHYMKIL